MKNQYLAPLLLVVAFFGCNTPEHKQNKSLDELASQYISLALEIGRYDADFIDAYYGPEKLRPKLALDTPLPYEELKWQTNDLINRLGTIDDMGFGKLELLRYQFLNKQLQAIRTKLDMMSGKIYPFDVESLRLYDVVAPHTKMAYYDTLLISLDEMLPGEGDLTSRYKEFSNDFIITPEKLDTVFQTAIQEARRRVSEHISLPNNESFELEYVTDKPWSGYNWYKGNGHSLIQLNTDFPIFIERAIDLACHEGYPGHHVFNVMLEKVLVNELGWNEFQVYPLFSPQSFIAEGSANYGIDISFEPEERLVFEKNVLFPLAGLDPDRAEEYYTIQSLRKELLGAEIQIARAYLNREIDGAEAAVQLEKYLQYEPERAGQRIRFFDRYRSYVINYSLGNQMVGIFIEEAMEANPASTKWDAYLELLTSPRTASTL